MKQIRRNISLDEKTDEKLKELALNAHTSVSQWITDCVWEKANDTDKKSKVVIRAVKTGEC